MPTGLPPSMSDGLTKMLSEIATLELAPDADPEFIGNIRGLLTSKIREIQSTDLGNQASTMMPPPSPTPQGADLAGNIQMPPPADPMAAGMPGMPGGGMPPPPGGGGVMGAGAPGPGRGFSPRPAPPNIDGLRRLLNPE